MHGLNCMPEVGLCFLYYGGEQLKWGNSYGLGGRVRFTGEVAGIMAGVNYFLPRQGTEEISLQPLNSYTLIKFSGTSQSSALHLFLHGNYFFGDDPQDEGVNLY